MSTRTFKLINGHIVVKDGNDHLYLGWSLPRAMVDHDRTLNDAERAQLAEIIREQDAQDLEKVA